MSAPLLLPSSLAQHGKTIFRGGVPFERMFCASCHASGPLVMVELQVKRFAHYLCDGCAPKYGKVDGLFAVPDDVFAEDMRQEQIERYGKVLDSDTLDEVLNDPNSTLAKLAKERPV